MWRLDHVLIHMIHVSRGPARDIVSECLSQDWMLLLVLETRGW